MSEVKYNVFIVDDDLNHAASIRDHLKKYQECTYFLFQSTEECFKNLHLKPALIFLDYELEPENKSYKSTEVLKQLKAKLPHTEVVLFTGTETVEVIEDTIHHGAYDYFIRDNNSHLKAEALIVRILHKHEIKEDLRWYKTFSRVLIGGLVVMAVVVFILYKMGYITDTVNEPFTD